MRSSYTRFQVLLLVAASCAANPVEQAPTGASGDEDSSVQTSDDDGPPANDGDGGGDSMGDGDSSGGDGDGGNDNGDPGVAPTDFTRAGPRAVTTTSDAVEVTSCTVDYSLYTPSTLDSQVLVVLGHGFQRDRTNVAGLAAHLASYGVRVVAPSYCHSWILDTDHPQNAVDAVELAALLAPGAAVIYAGHSAGGLAAVLAAAQDQDAYALLGLDTTDAGNAALGAAPGIDVPSLGIFGVPSSCNASGNGTAVFAAVPEAFAIRVTSANHCDFEDPTSGGCTAFCGASSDELRTVSRGLAAAFVAWKTGIDVTGRAWIEPTGSAYLELVADGVVVTLP